MADVQMRNDPQVLMQNGGSLNFRAAAPGNLNGQATAKHVVALAGCVPGRTGRFQTVVRVKLFLLRTRSDALGGL